jgi:mannose-P-dolichol utilization defect 1
LSGVTVFLQFAGSASRVFTTIQEVNDVLILTSFMIGFSLNCILLLQIVFMKKGEAPSTKEAVAKETKKNK